MTRREPFPAESNEQRYKLEKRDYFTRWECFERTGLAVRGGEGKAWLAKLARGESPSPPKARPLWPRHLRSQNE
jgi:hypothetical protein